MSKGETKAKFKRKKKKVLKSPLFSLPSSQLAKYKIKVNFKNSEGWKEKLPMLIHLELPLISVLKGGKKTNKSKNKLIKNKKKNHFLDFFKLILKIIAPKTNAGKIPKRI